VSAAGGWAGLSFTEQFRAGLPGYLRASLGLYVFSTLLLVVGIVFGALAASALAPWQREDLVAFVGGLMRDLGESAPGVDGPRVMRQALSNHLRTGAILWGLGITVVGVPLVAVVLFTRGFVLGFTVGFLVKELGWPGLVLASLAVFPPNLLAVPALLVLGVSSLSFSLLLLRTRFDRRRRLKLPEEFLAYTFLALGSGTLLVAASAVEAYLSPVFLRWLGPGLG